MNLFESTFNAGVTRLFLHWMGLFFFFFVIQTSEVGGVANNAALLEINNEK